MFKASLKSFKVDTFPILIFSIFGIIAFAPVVIKSLSYLSSNSLFVSKSLTKTFLFLESIFITSFFTFKSIPDFIVASAVRAIITFESSKNPPT